MSLHLTSMEIFWRLLSAFVGAFLIGLDRGEHGHTVGLRTTLLVCLAACLSMLQTNALLDLLGKTPDSFAVMDLMRLPLGILSGMGFIGGGAILRKDNLVSGVTTAATLWFVTVVGLCFGGGQLGIGWIGIGLAVLILAALRKLERKIPRETSGLLIVQVGEQGPSENELRKRVLQSKIKIKSTKVTRLPQEHRLRMEWSVRWLSSQSENASPALVDELATLPGLSYVEWSPVS